MFFKEEVHREALDTSIPNVFFSQILPIVEPMFIKIYLYGYYLCQGEQSELFDNQHLAQTLNVSMDDVMQAWDFFEECNLITKHRAENAEVWDYSVEFKNLKRFYNSKGELDISRERALVFKKNEEYEKMYDRLESILGTMIMSHQQRSLNEYIATHNVSKELVVEAFRYCVYKRGSRSVNHAMSVLRIWHSEGIRTVEDVQDFLMQKGERYGTYKKILSLLGEYRLPTKAEEALMDKWLDEYRFAMDVIEEAFSKLISVKKPSMAYVDGILRNWHKETMELNLQKKENAEKKDPTLFRLHILEALGIGRKLLTKDDVEILQYLYDHFSAEEISKTIEYMTKLNLTRTLSELHRLMKYPTIEDVKYAKTKETEIGREEIKDIVKRKKKSEEDDSQKQLADELSLLSRLRTDWSEE